MTDRESYFYNEPPPSNYKPEDHGWLQRGVERMIERFADDQLEDKLEDVKARQERTANPRLRENLEKAQALIEERIRSRPQKYKDQRND